MPAAGTETSQPIRREIVLGAGREDAVAAFTALTSARYRPTPRASATRCQAQPRLGDEISAAVAGAPDSVRAQLATLAAELPVDPVIVRAQWPGMDITAIEPYLAVLGKEVVRPLADVPVRDATVAIGS